MPLHLGERPRGYALQFSKISGSTPADLTTYYFGVQTITTVQGAIQVYVPYPGRVTAIYGQFFQAVGSNEASTLSLLHNGINNTVISSSLDHSATTTPFSKTDISQLVAAGDYCELRWITPAWFTNPTSLIMEATLWIKT